jgi:hypothetical protein
MMINHYRKKIPQQKKKLLAPVSFAVLTWSWRALRSKQSYRQKIVGSTMASGLGRRHGHGMEEGGRREHGLTRRV